MPYKNSESKRAWEERNRAKRNARRRDVRALESLVLEQVALPDANESSKVELLKQARKDGLYSRRNLKLRVDVGPASVVIPGDVVGRAVARAVRWWKAKR